jgi:ubiquinone biosynthesis protein UbiJ
MYNVFRLSGRHLDAAYVRELFDEPSTILYQVWSLIVTLDNATQPGTAIPIDDVRAQADALVLDVVKALDGDAESEIVEALQKLSRTLEGQATGEERSAEVAGAQAEVVNLVNTFYRDRLVVMPTIKEYIDQMQAEPAAH